MESIVMMPLSKYETMKETIESLKESERDLVRQIENEQNDIEEQKNAIEAWKFAHRNLAKKALILEYPLRFYSSLRINDDYYKERIKNELGIEPELLLELFEEIEQEEADRVTKEMENANG